MTVYELTPSLQRLRTLLAAQGLAMSDDAVIRLVADPSDHSLTLEVVEQTVKPKTGFYL